MIVRSINDVREAGNEVFSEGWVSRRYLLKKDQMGFSFHQTIIEEGAKLEMWYQNHLEAVFCTQGEGQITDLQSGQKHQIKPGVMYALDQHDQHILEAYSEMTMMCVFNPPVTGAEKHNTQGSYELEKE